MPEPIQILWRRDGPVIRVDVTFPDPKMVGLDCKLTIEMSAETLQSNGTSARKTVLTEPFKADALGNSFVIPIAEIDGFSFNGQHVRVTPQLVVTADDGVLWDTKVRVPLDLPMPARNDDALASGTPAQTLNPSDQISFVRNFGALPNGQKSLLAMMLLVFGVGGPCLFGLSLYDQFADQRIVFPPGWGFPPFIIGAVALVLSVVLLFVFYKTLLRGYMQVELNRDFDLVSPASRLRVSDLFTARARTSLTGVQVRVVAGSLECGEYVQRSGTDTNYIAFRRPVRAMVMYEKTTAAVPANVDVQQYFADDLDFGPMFAALYPPVMYSSCHGLELALKVQIIVPDLADFELPIPLERIDVTAFRQSAP
ncbi:MAG: hypothetical protein AAF141_00940 [Pseudomonadota bacterium]